MSQISVNEPRDLEEMDNPVAEAGILTPVAAARNTAVRTKFSWLFLFPIVVAMCGFVGCASGPGDSRSLSKQDPRFRQVEEENQVHGEVSAEYGASTGRYR